MSPPQARALRSRTASWTRSRITGWTCQVVPRHRSIERHLGVAPYNWNGSPHDTINAFAKRYENVECSALISWAVFSVECLHYLSDLDSAQAGASSTFDGHTANTIDIAHVRWATGTSVTALDLCAAGLGRAFCGIVDGDREDRLSDWSLRESLRVSESRSGRNISPLRPWSGPRLYVETFVTRSQKTLGIR